MKLIDEHHLQQRPVLDMITGKEIVATHYNFTAFVIFPVLTFGLFLCRPNVQTHREGLVQLNVFLQIPEYSLTTRLAVHPNASELVNTSKITKIETLTIGAIVTFINNESVQRQLTMSKEIPGGMANIVDVRMLPGPASYSLEMQALNVPEDKLLTYSTITWETIIVTKVVCPALLPPRKTTVDNPSQALDVDHRLSPVSDAANSTEGSRSLGDLLVRQIHQPRRGRGTQRRKTNVLGVAPNKRPPCLHVLTNCRFMSPLEHLFHMLL
ncbi:hypothetical protein F2Q70_00043918 [Brassica cretica]|uniref:Uncharacterized protein n=1 Tax=Brassica cretica TaxID=69181 RepID=A0A8S9KJT0_BRACR|nr:hypothetical protein F2Q70_00043918 [Brassica cretica]